MSCVPCHTVGSGLQFSSLGRAVQGLTAPLIQWSAHENPVKWWSAQGVRVAIHVLWKFRTTTEKGREGRTRVSGFSLLFFSLVREAAQDGRKEPRIRSPRVWASTLSPWEATPALSESPVLYLSSGDGNTCLGDWLLDLDHESQAQATPKSWDSTEFFCESPSPRETSPKSFPEPILLASNEIIYLRDFSRDWGTFLRYFVKLYCNIHGRGQGGAGQCLYNFFGIDYLTEFIISQRCGPSLSAASPQPLLFSWSQRDGGQEVSSAVWTHPAGTGYPVSLVFTG